MAKSAKVKAKAKVMWESRIASRKIAETVGVSDHHTILDWAEEGGWVKGAITPKLAQKEEEATLEVARELGLNKAYFLSKVKLLCEATIPVLAKGDEDEEGDEAKVKEVPDYKAISNGLAHAKDIIPGLKVSEKIDITSGGRSLLDEVLDEV